MAFHVPEKNRVRSGPYKTTERNGNNGLFHVQLRKGAPVFKIIACQEAGWEHVSISLPDRCPLWKEMCQIKDIFWDDTDVVMQLHPAKENYVSIHPFCLHLWRPMLQAIPLPPTIMV